jgi:hypothetical protein
MTGEPEKVTRGACIIEETFDPTMVVIGAMTQIGRHELPAGCGGDVPYLAPVTRYLVRRRKNNPEFKA